MHLDGSRSQTFLEAYTLLLSLIAWPPSSTSGPERLGVLGDNVGALQNALSLSGKGPLLTVAREIAWRQAAEGWHFSVGHIPTESNTVADALSRLSAPEPASFPDALRDVPEMPVIEQGRAIWRAL